MRDYYLCILYKIMIVLSCIEKQMIMKNDIKSSCKF